MPDISILSTYVVMFIFRAHGSQVAGIFRYTEEKNVYSGVLLNERRSANGKRA